jgi:hypothetical protein
VHFDPGAVTDVVPLQMMDAIWAVVGFIFSLYHQDELSKSAHYIGAVLLVFGFVLLASTVLEYLRSMVQRPSVQRPKLLELLIKIVWIIVGYLIGLFSRAVAEPFTTAPRVGHFGVETIFMPLIILILLLIMFYQQRMMFEPNRQIHQWVSKPLNAAKLIV